MKTVTKAAIAGGIGVALLLGGAGTVAFWTDSADGGNGIISAGTLEIGDLGARGWQISHVGDGDPASAPTPEEFFPSEDQIVPGDILYYTQSIPIELQGNNIAASFVGTLVVDAPEGATDADSALASAIVDDGKLEITGLQGSLDREGNRITGPGSGTVEVTTEIIFPWGDSGDFNDAKLGDLEFSIDYTLTQETGK